MCSRTEAETEMAIVADYSSGLNSREVAIKHRVSKPTVLNVLRRMNVDVRGSTRPRRWDMPEEAAFRYQSNSTCIVDLSKEFLVSNKIVVRELCRHGVFIRPENTRRRYSLNEKAFDDERLSVEAAYWIGFLLADGCVSGDRFLLLTLSDIDIEHVRKLRDFLGSTHPITIEKSNGFRNSAPCARLVIHSPYLVRSLSRFGIVPRKSNVATASPEMAMNQDFWRGVIEGDGWVRIYNNSFCLGLCGSEAIVRQFTEFASPIAQCKFDVRLNGLSKNCWRTEIRGRHGLAVARVMYAGNPVSLDRKREVAERVIQAYADQPSVSPLRYLPSGRLTGLTRE